MQWDWSPDNYETARANAEEAIAKDPSNPAGRREWAWLSLVGWVFEYVAEPKPIQEILDQANAAVQLDPTDARARMIAASAYFFAKQLKLFQNEAKQALALAPYDVENEVIIGALTANMGDWEQGVQLVTEANRRNAAAAKGWYHSTIYLNDYMNGRYASALSVILQNPDFSPNCNVVSECVKYAFLDYIAICGQLGMTSEARDAWHKVLAMDPSASLETFTKWYRLWNFREEDVAKLVDGVQKSGVLDDNPSLQAKSAGTAN
jgi:tetratricopeptide (TPR) repeat protein